MKTRIILFAAACAALVACSKENAATDNPSEGTAFQKDQVVTIGVSSREVSTKVTGTDDGTNINLVWDEGDKILVTVGGKSATFTLASGKGTSSATFTGTMPGSGSSFDIQYPTETPDLGSQTYEEGKFPSEKLSFSATGCTLDKTAELTATNSVLQLNLYGAARSVNNITVTKTGTSDTYTLTCSTAKFLGKDKDNAITFYVVVPAGSYKFDVNVSVNALTSTKLNTVSYETYGIGTVFSASTFSTSTAQTFTAGKVLNMPAKSVTTVWAPVNCGYEPATTSPAYSGYPYGKFYQWGRKYGQGYEGDATTATIAEYWTGTNGNEDSNTFYKKCTSGGTYGDDWIQNGSNAYWNTGNESAPIKTKYDPCPNGWRVPTYAELNALTGNKGSTDIKSAGWDETNKGYWFNGTSKPSSGDGLFLPAAGYRQDSNGTAYNRDVNGRYWSSSVNGNNGRYLHFFSVSGLISAYMYEYGRAYGYSVRCVQE